MSWLGHLNLRYCLDGRRTTALDRHHGPLRVLQRLYPEGEAICHHVLVHPPGGIVGGDVLEINAELAEGTHALITTPGATRYYRSAGQPAMQRVRARLEPGARLEWLPLETIAYRQCIAENHLHFDLAPGAEMIGWDLLALGLPAASEHWDRGRYTQHLELPDVWREQAVIDAKDHRLLDSPVGWAGRLVLVTLWFAAGTALPGDRRNHLLDSARAVASRSPLAPTTNATAPHAPWCCACWPTGGADHATDGRRAQHLAPGRVATRPPGAAHLAHLRPTDRLAPWTRRSLPPLAVSDCC